MKLKQKFNIGDKVYIFHQNKIVYCEVIGFRKIPTYQSFYSNHHEYKLQTIQDLNSDEFNYQFKWVFEENGEYRERKSFTNKVIKEWINQFYLYTTVEEYFIKQGNRNELIKCIKNEN